MPVPTLCKICLTIKEDCAIVGRIGDNTPTQFIKEIFQIEVEPEMCIMCKRCEGELTNFYVFYKLVKDAHKKNICTLEGEYLMHGNMVIIQEVLHMPNIENEQNIIKEEISDSENVTFDTDFVYLDADKNNQIDFEEVIDVDKQVNTAPTKVDSNIDKSMRVFDVKKELLEAKSRHKQAVKTFVSKYSMNHVYENEKWLINDEEKKEISSWFVELKCNFAVCSELANFKNMSDLEQHSISVHDSYPRLFCCSHLYTPDSVLHMHVLEKHLKNNRKVKNIYVECNVCGKSVRKLNMKHHLYRHLPNDKKNFQCDKCDARFLVKCKLKYHMESFHSTQTVPCDICGKIYKNKASMEIHKRTHMEKKRNSYLCPECGRKIENLSHFEQHMDEHYGKEVKVKCEICSKVVKRLSFRRHMRMHDPSVQKQCPHCPYKTSFSLNFHIKQIHEKVKPHTCSYCPMKFSTQKAMGDHISSRHTGIPRYNCPFCDKTFMHSGNWFTHQKRMHPKELAEKKSKMVVKTDNIPVGKLKKERITILQGEASVVLENKLMTTKASRICDTMEPRIMSTANGNM